MKRNVLVGGLVAAALSMVSASALANEGKDWNQHGISAFDTEPMGGGEKAEVQSPPVKDAPPPSEPKEAPLMTKPGLVFQFGSGMRYLGGSAASGVDMSGVFFDFDVKIGVYVNQHLGFFGGAEAGVGSLTKGCAGDCSDAMHFAFPVSVQYAFVDRVRGPYIEAGLVFAPTYMGSTPSSSTASPETLKVSAPMDGRFGVGYRIPVKSVFGGLYSALDLHLGMDLGKFDSIDYENVVGGVSGDIPSDQNALHYAFALNLDWHFAL